MSVINSQFFPLLRTPPATPVLSPSSVLPETSTDSQFVPLLQAADQLIADLPPDEQEEARQAIDNVIRQGMPGQETPAQRAATDTAGPASWQTGGMLPATAQTQETPAQRAATAATEGIERRFDERSAGDQSLRDQNVAQYGDPRAAALQQLREAQQQLREAQAQGQGPVSGPLSGAQSGAKAIGAMQAGKMTVSPLHEENRGYPTNVVPQPQAEQAPLEGVSHQERLLHLAGVQPSPAMNPETFGDYAGRTNILPGRSIPRKTKYPGGGIALHGIVTDPVRESFGRKGEFPVRESFGRKGELKDRYTRQVALRRKMKEKLKSTRKSRLLDALADTQGDGTPEVDSPSVTREIAVETNRIGQKYDKIATQQMGPDYLRTGDRNQLLVLRENARTEIATATGAIREKWTDKRKAASDVLAEGRRTKAVALAEDRESERNLVIQYREEGYTTKEALAQAAADIKALQDARQGIATEPESAAGSPGVVKPEYTMAQIFPEGLRKTTYATPDDLDDSLIAKGYMDEEGNFLEALHPTMRKKIEEYRLRTWGPGETEVTRAKTAKQRAKTSTKREVAARRRKKELDEARAFSMPPLPR
jgi:hypothetical protein